jgi:hypothetical protein
MWDKIFLINMYTVITEKLYYAYKTYDSNTFHINNGTYVPLNL